VEVNYSGDDDNPWSRPIENAERPTLQHRSPESTAILLMQFRELRQQLEESAEILQSSRSVPGETLAR